MRADALVLFGATGDLAHKKLFPALYQICRKGELGIPVVGVALSGWADDKLRAYAAESVRTAVPAPEEAPLEDLLRSLVMVDGDYRNRSTYAALADRLARVRRPVCYLAIPPALFGDVAEGLGSIGMHKTGRILLEKPFGRDLASARALNRTLHAVFPESSICRIDHYLGKESVQDLLVFRFANSIFEPIWNRRYVRSVQVTMAESFGVAGRGAFYDGVGAIRDVVQNHLLEVVALLAMEPPVGSDANALRDEKAKVLRAMKPVDPTAVVRGQYRGYLEEAGVAAGSTVETFAAIRLEIDSWRWAGIPFYVRAGKALPTTATEAVVEFTAPPRMLFTSGDVRDPHPDVIRFRLGKNDGVTIEVQVKKPGPATVTERVGLRVDFAEALGVREEAYERLLGAALAGDTGLFARKDIVERAWEIVQPILDDPGPVIPYDRGSWGPAQADRLIVNRDGWHSTES